jgi:hemerythrin
MEWNEELSLGNDFLDNEHKGIIRLLNALKSYGDSTFRSDSIISKLLSSLRIEVGKHFIDEELLMKHNGCPISKLNEHTKGHAMIMMRLAETHNVSEEALHKKIPFLSEMLILHMTKVDYGCISYLTNSEWYIP